LLDLKSLEGSVITGLFYPLNLTLLVKVKLHRVEPYGLWIESQELTDKLLATRGAASSSKTGVLFIPWSQIAVIVDSLDEPALSEKSFGL
jgi:hypothetical protein